jgi:hypothetical protein
MYAIEVGQCHDTYIPSFMKTGKSVQTILRFSLAT